MPGPAPKPYKPHLLTRWDHWRVSWLVLVCSAIKLVTFARWLPQWDTLWKMSVVEKRMNDREGRQPGPPKARPTPKPRPAAR